VGVESTDLVLVLKSPASLERVLKGKGKLTLGTDASVAARPLGRDAEVARTNC
jgi:lipid-binding SYLF domain-containing protein